MLPSRPLLETDTIPALAREGLIEAKAAQEAARMAAIKGAKTNLQYLMAVGVVCSVEDEYDRAMAHASDEERAKRDGITIAEAREQRIVEVAEENVRAELCVWVQGKESSPEFYARRDAAQAAAQGTMDNGKPCKHRATARFRGWHNMNRYDSFCCRCGATVAMEPPVEPTEQALVAARILAKEIP